MTDLHVPENDRNEKPGHLCCAHGIWLFVASHFHHESAQRRRQIQEKSISHKERMFLEVADRHKQCTNASDLKDYAIEECPDLENAAESEDLAFQTSTKPFQTLHLTESFQSSGKLHGKQHSIQNGQKIYHLSWDKEPLQHDRPIGDATTQVSEAQPRTQLAPTRDVSPPGSPDLQAFIAELKNLQSENEDLLHLQAANEDLQHKVVDLTTQLAQAQRYTAVDPTDLRHLLSEKEEVRHLQAQNQELESQIVDLRHLQFESEELVYLQSEDVEVRHQEAWQCMKQEFQFLSTELACMNGANDVANLRAEYDYFKADCQKVLEMDEKNQFRNLRSLGVAAESQVARMKTEFQSLTSNHANLKTEYDQIKVASKSEFLEWQGQKSVFEEELQILRRLELSTAAPNVDQVGSLNGPNGISNATPSEFNPKLSASNSLLVECASLASELNETLVQHKEEKRQWVEERTKLLDVACAQSSNGSEELGGVGKFRMADQLKMRDFLADQLRTEYNQLKANELSMHQELASLIASHANLRTECCQLEANEQCSQWEHASLTASHANQMAEYDRSYASLTASHANLMAEYDQSRVASNSEEASSSQLELMQDLEQQAIAEAIFLRGHIAEIEDSCQRKVEVMNLTEQQAISEAAWLREMFITMEQPSVAEMEPRKAPMLPKEMCLSESSRGSNASSTSQARLPKDHKASRTSPVMTPDRSSGPIFGPGSSAVRERSQDSRSPNASGTGSHVAAPILVRVASSPIPFGVQSFDRQYQKGPLIRARSPSTDGAIIRSSSPIMLANSPSESSLLGLPSVTSPGVRRAASPESLSSVRSPIVRRAGSPDNSPSVRTPVRSPIDSPSVRTPVRSPIVHRAASPDNPSSVRSPPLRRTGASPVASKDQSLPRTPPSATSNPRTPPSVRTPSSVTSNPRTPPSVASNPSKNTNQGSRMRGAVRERTQGPNAGVGSTASLSITRPSKTSSITRPVRPTK